MPEGFARVKRGEKRPIFAQVTAQEGTLTIGSSPAPVCTLYDAGGEPVSGLSGVAVTGCDTGAQEAPRAWFNLDTTSPTDLSAGFYTLVFTFSATGSDGITRVYRPGVEVQVTEEQA
jgi:hypothetical protein